MFDDSDVMMSRMWFGCESPLNPVKPDVENMIKAFEDICISSEIIDRYH